MSFGPSGRVLSTWRPCILPFLGLPAPACHAPVARYRRRSPFLTNHWFPKSFLVFSAFYSFFSAREVFCSSMVSALDTTNSIPLSFFFPPYEAASFLTFTFAPLFPSWNKNCLRQLPSSLCREARYAARPTFPLSLHTSRPILFA